jgi:protein-tyrosine phosphatase
LDKRGRNTVSGALTVSSRKSLRSSISNVREQRFGIADAEIDPLSVPEILQLADWLFSEWKLGKKVAARCQAGWNRSGLIVALVLLKDGFTAEEAISLIRDRRSPNALCNPHFVKFIQEISSHRSPIAR